jgi:hypothetical protein
MSKTVRLVLFFFILSIAAAVAQSKEEGIAKDKQIVKGYFHLLKTDEKEPFSPGESVIKAALYLLNTPYVSGALEINKREELVVNLHGLDCMTFVESCLALSRSAQYPVPDYDDFVRELKKIRYRDGVINGYTSRLHYTTDWIYNNADKGIIEDITYALGGKKFKPQVSYMSEHPDLYPALKNNQEEIEIMAEIEKQINQRNSYYYISRNEIKGKASLIKNGDIIGFTTSLPGLDISHLGIAYWNKGQLSFIHASLKFKKVIINTESISDYCLLNRNNTGIVVLRTMSNRQ